MSEPKPCSRRAFLQFTGAAAAAVAAVGIARPAPAEEHVHAHATPLTREQANDKPLFRARMFFTNDTEFATLSEAAERIFPRDENGPGAKDLAVPYFIDNQLAGAWGYNAREYTGGPFFDGADTQGTQTPVLRRDIFKQGLQMLNATARERHGKDFSRLDAAQQDQILGACAEGTLPTSGFTSDVFFSLLRGAVVAGAYADPMYNGNNNMDGWRMKQYPGAQMAYTYLMTEETFQIVEPVSLAFMQ